MRPRVHELVAVEHVPGALAGQTPSNGEGEGDDHCGLCGLTEDRDAWEAVG